MKSLGKEIRGITKNLPSQQFLRAKMTQERDISRDEELLQPAIELEKMQIAKTKNEVEGGKCKKRKVLRIA